jgi:formyltetrahydrofolate synthetase
MVNFFFYNHLTNLDLIKKININFEICDGYIIIQNYDIKNNLLDFIDKSSKNNEILYGKIVNFNMKLDDIIKKINEIDECKLENKIKYTLEEIWVNPTFEETKHKAYIIY